jgi:hypothetical protein
MKELIQSILKKEDELKNKAGEAQKQSQEILNSAKLKVAAMEKDYEQRFQQEKEKKTNGVLNKAKEREEVLKRKTNEDIEELRSLLNKKKNEIKTKIFEMILE